MNLGFDILKALIENSDNLAVIFVCIAFLAHKALK